MKNSFLIKKLEFNYTDKEERIDSERRVEVSLGKYFLLSFPSENIIEIGAVMPYYIDTKHHVVDPYDNHDVCDKKSIFDVDLTGKNVLSISTIEHIGKLDYGNKIENNDGCINSFKKIKQEANKYLITFPIGYNLYLDNFIKTETENILYLKRINQENEWVETNKEDVYSLKYNFPYKWGNGLIIITNLF